LLHRKSLSKTRKLKNVAKSKFLIIFVVLLLVFVEKALPNPKYAPILYNLGHQYEEKKNSSRATRYYKRALRSDPDLPWANYRLGLQAKDSGSVEQAAQYFHNEIYLNSSSCEPYYELSLIYLENKAYAKALKYIRRVLEIRYDNPQHHYVYGLACLYSGYLHDAVCKVEDLEGGGHYDFAQKLRRAISENK